MRAKDKHQPQGSYRHKLNDHDVTFETWEEWAFAELLEDNHVLWEYEPQRFVFEHNDDRDHTTAFAFQPDFHLPAQGMFVEITRTKEIARLERKARQLGVMRQHHPEHPVVLLASEQLSSIFQRDGNRVFAPGELLHWLNGLHQQWMDVNAREWLSERERRWLHVLPEAHPA